MGEDGYGDPTLENASKSELEVHVYASWALSGVS